MPTPIDAALSDPSLSFWLRGALASALRRDPQDAIEDAKLLAELLSIRSDALAAGRIPCAAGGQEFADTVRLPLI